MELRDGPDLRIDRVDQCVAIEKGYPTRGKGSLTVTASCRSAGSTHATTTHSGCPPSLAGQPRSTASPRSTKPAAVAPPGPRLWETVSSKRLSFRTCV